MNLQEIQPKIQKLAKEYHLSLVLLFGSQVKGKISVHSDFDVAYLSAKQLNLMNEARLSCDLMPILKSDQVDLVNLKKAPPLLMKQIFQQHQILFCADKSQYFAYQMYALRKYLEAKPLFILRDKAINNFLKSHA
jgi:uncharacterized protein